MNEKYIDLHVHTNFSDGFDDIATALKKAKDNNVGVISFTEHYNLSSFLIAKHYAQNDIEVIPGIEIGADMSSIASGKNHICHMLGYYVSNSIQTLLDQYELDRYDCAIKSLELLKKKGINISIQDVIIYARDRKSIGRYDIAIALANLGFANSPQEAYGLYLDHNGACYVNRNKLEPCELVKAIIEHGGVPVLAHPKSLHINDDNKREFIRILKEAGLCGIEVYNPNNTQEQRDFFLKLCDEFDLIPTVGSDYHGGNRKPEILIGRGIDDNLCISNMEIIEQLKTKKKLLKNNKLR